MTTVRGAIGGVPCVCGHARASHTVHYPGGLDIGCRDCECERYRVNACWECGGRGYRRDNPGFACPVCTGSGVQVSRNATPDTVAGSALYGKTRENTDGALVASGTVTETGPRTLVCDGCGAPSSSVWLAGEDFYLCAECARVVPGVAS